MKLTKVISLAIFGAFLLTGCSFLTPQAPIKKDMDLNLTSIKDKSQNEKALKIEALANKYVGKKSGKDCSGFVSLINNKSDHIYFKEANLSRFYSKYGFKSEAIFNLYQNKNLITQTEPKVGDLIFFNNTTSKTRKYKKKKVITHIGIVDKIYDDGTVGFIHHSGKVIKKGFINLNLKNKHKDGKKELNSYVIRCKNSNVACLSSNRFAGFGSVKF